MVTYLNDCLKNDLLPEIKSLNNPKLGITVKSMKAKIHGCFQSNFSRVTITISDHCLGKTCNGSDFSDNLEKVRIVLMNNYFTQK
jgi:hypothetical protein